MYEFYEKQIFLCWQMKKTKIVNLLIAFDGTEGAQIEQKADGFGTQRSRTGKLKPTKDPIM